MRFPDKPVSDESDVTVRTYPMNTDSPNND